VGTGDDPGRGASAALAPLTGAAFDCGKVAGAFGSQEAAVAVPHLQERARLCPSGKRGWSRARGSAKTLTYRESEEPVLELERSCPLIPGHQADAYDQYRLSCAARSNQLARYTHQRGTTARRMCRRKKLKIVVL